MHACIDLLGLHQSRAELLDLCVHARGRAAGLVQFSKQLGIVLDVAGHVAACCGDGDCWPRSRQRLPYAPVGKPDPYQAGELVVCERVRLGSGAGHGPVPLTGARVEPDHCPRQAGRGDCLPELGAEGGRVSTGEQPPVRRRGTRSRAGQTGG